MKLIPWRRSHAIDKPKPEEPNPAVAFAVGLLYVFGTRPGHRILRDLERAVRRYAADPAALMDLVRGGDEAIDTTATVEPSHEELPGERRNRLPKP